MRKNIKARIVARAVSVKTGEPYLWKGRTVTHQWVSFAFIMDKICNDELDLSEWNIETKIAEFIYG